MKSCKLLLFLPVLVGIVSGYCNQYSETSRLREQIEVCESGATPFRVFDLLRQKSFDALTFEQFVEQLYSFCDKIPSETLACLTQNINVREDCQEVEEIQGMVNFKVMSWYSTSILCANNATRYLEIAADDGPTCFANNDAHGQCLSQPKYMEIISKMAPSSNRNICDLFYMSQDCLSAFDSCENQNVRLHSGYVNQQLQYRFGCLNTR